MNRFNLFEAVVPSDPQRARPEGFRSREVQLGALLGANRMGATLYELPPGERLGPYHYEHNNEEWLLVIAGQPTLRTPEGEYELRAGDLVVFPEGPHGAHAITNRTGAPVRLVMLSTKRRPAVAVYPDSDKIAIWRIEDDGIIVRRSDATDYWDGERP
jgi:uncharacterized cupin superfamily protein